MFYLLVIGLVAVGIGVYLYQRQQEFHVKAANTIPWSKFNKMINLNMDSAYN